MRCMHLSDRVEHHHRCQRGFAPPRQFGSSAGVRHVSRQYARTAGISCSDVVATCPLSVHVYCSVHVLQHSTFLRTAQPSRQDSSNVSSSAEGTNNEAGSLRAADASSSRASLDDGAGDMPDEFAIVPSGNGSIETAAGEAFQSSQPAQPPDDAPPLLSGVQKVLAAALLVSPFFFWGTSMVGMKVSVSPIWAQPRRPSHSHRSSCRSCTPAAQYKVQLQALFPDTAHSLVPGAGAAHQPAVCERLAAGPRGRAAAGVGRLQGPPAAGRRHGLGLHRGLQPGGRHVLPGAAERTGACDAAAAGSMCACSLPLDTSDKHDVLVFVCKL